MISDIRNYKNNSLSKSYLAVFLNPCFYATLLYRLSNLLYKSKLTVFAKIIWFLNRIIFSIDIDYRAEIGNNFTLVHGIGVVIGYDVEIGDNCKIYQGVTLGGNAKTRNVNNKQLSQPKVGDNCIIFTNACVFGPVIVNDNSVIKACSIVTSDIGYEEKL